MLFMLTSVIGARGIVYQRGETVALLKNRIGFKYARAPREPEAGLMDTHVLNAVSL